MYDGIQVIIVNVIQTDYFNNNESVYLFDMSLSDKVLSGMDQSDMVQSGRNLFLQGQSGMSLCCMVLSGKDLFDMDQFHMSLSCMGLRESKVYSIILSVLFMKVL